MAAKVVLSLLLVILACELYPDIVQFSGTVCLLMNLSLALPPIKLIRDSTYEKINSNLTSKDKNQNI